MSTNLNLGKIITDASAAKDAIHVAIAPVTAGDHLQPGQHVKLVPDGSAIRAPVGRGIGIVDPFLHQAVEAGQRFYLFLYPNTVTGLRHDWSHPAFVEPTPADAEQDDFCRENCHPSAYGKGAAALAEAKNWLGEFARSIDMPYAELIDEASRPGGYVVSHGSDAHGFADFDIDADEFWGHMEAVTGKTFGEDHRKGIVWTCSC